MRVGWIVGVRMVAAAVIMIGVLGLMVEPSQAHGQPVEGLESRNSFCTKTKSRPTLNKENPACAKAYMGPEGDQPGYDPFESNQANGTVHSSNGQVGPLIRDVVPDGQLCGAGRDKYAGFNTPTSAWPYRKYAPGATLRYKYTAWAHHPGRVDLYASKPGYDPTVEPLGWDDLEAEPFDSLSTDQPNGQSEEHFSATYEKDITLPDRTGRLIVAAIWARSDSPEVFYYCSDVVLEAGASGEVYNLGAVEGEVADPIVSAEEAPPGDEEPTEETAPATSEPAAETNDAPTPEPEPESGGGSDLVASAPDSGVDETDDTPKKAVVRNVLMGFLAVVTVLVVFLQMRPSPGEPKPTQIDISL